MIEKIKKQEITEEDWNKITTKRKTGDYWIKVKDLEKHLQEETHWYNSDLMSEIFCTYFNNKARDKFGSKLGRIFSDTFFERVGDFIKGEMDELFEYLKDPGAIELVDECEMIIEDGDKLIIIKD